MAEKASPYPSYSELHLNSLLRLNRRRQAVRGWGVVLFAAATAGGRWGLRRARAELVTAVQLNHFDKDGPCVHGESSWLRSKYERCNLLPFGNSSYIGPLYVSVLFVAFGP